MQFVTIDAVIFSAIDCDRISHAGDTGPACPDLVDQRPPDYEACGAEPE